MDDEADRFYGPHESKIKQAYNKDIEKKLKQKKDVVTIPHSTGMERDIDRALEAKIENIDSYEKSNFVQKSELSNKETTLGWKRN